MQPPLYTSDPQQPLPRFALVHQQVDTAHLADPQATLIAELLPYLDLFRPGMRVAITAGSRGITQIAALTATLVATLQRVGAQPFIVPAMGSHGGATADGQRAVLAGYGIDQQRMGCPVHATMETRVVATTDAGLPVHCQAAAAQADAIILLNRVKPHTILGGNLGSGLMKIAAIGLGCHAGAASIHAAGLAEHLLPVARQILAHTPVVLGIALVENAAEQIRSLRVVPPHAIESTDRQLLAEARSILPTVPFEPLDLLVIDQIGKHISGTGMDPNVIGMHRRIGGVADRQIDRIVALSLAAASHGNANGVGMADLITRELRDAIDWPATWANALTADFLAGLKLPLACATARDAVALALNGRDPQRTRAVRIRDTAHLEQFWVSEALLAEVDAHPHLTQLSDLQALW